MVGLRCLCMGEWGYLPAIITSDYCHLTPIPNHVLSLDPQVVLGGGQTAVFMPRDNGQNPVYQAGETAQPKSAPGWVTMATDGQLEPALAEWGGAPPAVSGLIPLSGPQKRS